MTELQQYVQDLLVQHQGKRILSFTYDGEQYWLKQPEKIRGIWRLLKPNGDKAFQHELQTLAELNQLQAPVAELVLQGDNFFVLKDVGKTVNLWVEDEQVSAAQKQQILNDCAAALADLHQQNIAHGRPILRDIAWRDGTVRFLDLESIVRSSNLTYQKIRDVLVFMHGLFRAKQVSREQAETAINYYEQNDTQQILAKSICLLVKLRGIYYFLLLFKPVAKMDLIGLYQLFEFVLKSRK